MQILFPAVSDIHVFGEISPEAVRQLTSSGHVAIDHFLDGYPDREAIHKAVACIAVGDIPNDCSLAKRYTSGGAWISDTSHDQYRPLAALYDCIAGQVVSHMSRIGFVENGRNQGRNPYAPRTGLHVARNIMRPFAHHREHSDMHVYGVTAVIGTAGSGLVSVTNSGDCIPETEVTRSLYEMNIDDLMLYANGLWGVDQGVFPRHSSTNASIGTDREVVLLDEREIPTDVMF